MAKETVTYLPAPRTWALRTRVRGTRAASEERDPPSSGSLPRRRRKSMVAERVKRRTREAKAATAAFVPHRRCQMGAWWREIAIGVLEEGKERGSGSPNSASTFCSPRQLLLGPTLTHFLLLGALLSVQIKKKFWRRRRFCCGLVTIPDLIHIMPSINY